MTIKTISYFLLGIAAAGIITGTFFMDRRASQSGNSFPTIGIGGAPPTSAPQTESEVLKKETTAIFEQQANLMSVSLRNIFINTPSTVNTPQELDTNIVKLSEIIKEQYGENNAQRLVTLWRNYTSYFMDYAVASKANQEEQKATALENINSSREEIITFLASLNPYLIDESFAPHFTYYTDSFVNVVDSYQAENYGLSYDTQINAIQTGNDLATSLTNSLIRQFPEKFR